MSLTFEEVSVANEERRLLWHKDEIGPGWSGADYSNAMCGEAGEAANVVKKLRRLETNLGGHANGGVVGGDGTERQLRAKLGAEIADTYIYLDMLATFYGIDIGAQIVRKFNDTSRAKGFDVLIGE